MINPMKEAIDVALVCIALCAHKERNSFSTAKNDDEREYIVKNLVLYSRASGYLQRMIEEAINE